MIEFKNVSKTYRNGTHALYDVNLNISDGEFVYIMGPTGAGKSTLIKLLDGEEVPTRGSVIVSGVDVGKIKKSKVYLYRRKIGVVFQDFRLLPEKTVFENVAYALEILDMPTDKIRKRVREVLKLVEMADKSNSKPRELSGGQQQRVAIARAIAKKPTLLIADEPTGNLDNKMVGEIMRVFERINAEEKTTIILITHNDVMVEYNPKRTITIESGHVVSDKRYDDIRPEDISKLAEKIAEPVKEENSQIKEEVNNESEHVEENIEEKKEETADTLKVEVVDENNSGDRQ